MQNIDINTILNLIPSEPFKAIILLMLLNKDLREKLIRFSIWILKQLTKYLPLLKKRLDCELKELNNELPPPSQHSKKVSAWGEISIYTLFSAYLTIEGALFLAIVVSLAFANELTLLKMLLASGMILSLWGAAWFFRASAHKVANKNGFNKYLWKQHII